MGIDEENIFGEVDNKKKKEFFLNLKKTNTKSMMIGDGMNDILSLSEADFGISFNAASQLNLVAADIIFIKEDLRLIYILLKLSKLTFVFIWINIFWAFFYNICLLPITSGAFHSFWDVEMSPTLSSFSMLCLGVVLFARPRLYLHISDLRNVLGALAGLVIALGARLLDVGSSAVGRATLLLTASGSERAHR